MIINRLILISVLVVVPTFAFAADLGDLAVILDVLGKVSLPQYAVYVLFSVVGVVVHIVLDIYKGIIVTLPGDSFMARVKTYLFKTRVAATMNMVLSVLVLGATYFSVTPQPIAWTTLIIAALTAGYTSDSLFNRSK